MLETSWNHQPDNHKNKKTSAPRVYMQSGNATWKIFFLQIWKKQLHMHLVDVPWFSMSRLISTWRLHDLKCTVYNVLLGFTWFHGPRWVWCLNSSHLVTSSTRLYILGWCAARDSLKFGINEQSCLTRLLTLHHGTWNTWRLRRRNLMGTWEPDPAIGDLPLPLPQKTNGMFNCRVRLPEGLSMLIKGIKSSRCQPY